MIRILSKKAGAVQAHLAVRSVGQRFYQTIQLMLNPSAAFQQLNNRWFPPILFL